MWVVITVLCRLTQNYLSLCGMLLMVQESVVQMKKVVEELEAAKRQLLARTTAAASSSSSNSDTTNVTAPAVLAPLQPSGASHSTSASAAAATTIQRDDFVRLTEQIEQLRLANAALASDLHERDLFNSSMQHLLLDFRREIGDNDDGDNDEEVRQRVLIGFTPLRPDEVAHFIAQALQQCRNARLSHAAEGHYRSTAEVFGWSDFRARQGSTITFSVKKRITNVRPADLVASMWDCVTDSIKIGCLLPPTLTCDLRVLQRVSESVLIIDRRTYTKSQSSLPALPTLRTVMVVFRVHDPSDNTDVLIMKTLDTPLVKNLLLRDELWCDVLYYVRCEPSPPAGPAKWEANGDSTADTTVEIGGILKYVREEFATSWLAELLFLAVRWESVAVRPVLLKSF